MAVTLSQLLSGQVLSWPVDADAEENAATNEKEGRELKKDSAKVGCWERTMTKLHLSCKSSDGRTRILLLDQFGVPESHPQNQTSPKVPPLLWGEGSSC